MIEFIWDSLSGPNFDLYRGLFNLSAALIGCHVGISHWSLHLGGFPRDADLKVYMGQSEQGKEGHSRLWPITGCRATSRP